MLKIVNSIPVAQVWSGHPVGFDLVTHGDRQFAAFYDAERRMTVSCRGLDSGAWAFVRPEGRWLEGRNRPSTTIAWDSHNYVTMAIDGEGQVHLCGNMHCDPLIYFRTTRPLDIFSFERIDRMVGQNEERCTYPRFMRGPKGELVFRYRDGRSGDGVDYYNVYDAGTRTWRRLIDAPLLDGQGRMNAYARAPMPGPDGMYHLVWMWRDTPDCATNHDISYARSRDLVRWETSRGEALALPITLETGEVVDAVPPGGGTINMCLSLGFDTKQRPIISYLKYDEAGATQAYNARREAEGWKVSRTSDWAYRWAFSGGGAIPGEVQVGGVQVESDGGLNQSYRHIREGAGVWRLDEATLRPAGTYPPRKDALPEALLKVASDFPGLEAHTLTGRGEGPEPGVRYVLRWETLPANRDRPREQAPPPSELRLYELRLE
ncbi:MAG: hypothetical protein A3F84_28205 [Candidatus Handelsmanbacteria bacterium RIFCSPLOWO2_12_FULL_64_10]|uniref:Neuraminidase n=1 Tax=Handelsmanbacteria sp. (strain RIFCSPLOWO2_12_FULL_64_10) TaxID=1817868 RepID=A0A1F6CBF3_HANXR|nr:MAG: hypothetical protein A3F84_28205 [Candidatus Handelsmanbacteria bacterium RIFCSPLOWO2_12_FULL_64_10]